MANRAIHRTQEVVGLASQHSLARAGDDGILHEMKMREPTPDDHPQILRLLGRALLPSDYESSLVVRLYRNHKIAFDFGKALLAGHVMYKEEFIG